MKTVYLRRIILLLAFALLVPNTSAQDANKWSLPEIGGQRTAHRFPMTDD